MFFISRPPIFCIGIYYQQKKEYEGYFGKKFGLDGKYWFCE